jgi:hypothetical protein
MKNLLFILTVLLCTVSCSKKKNVQPIQNKQFDWNEQLKQCNKYTNWNNDTYLFVNNTTLQITGKNVKYSGNYTIISNNVLNTNIYYSTWVSNTYNNCIKSNDSIYYGKNFLFKEIK